MDPKRKASSKPKKRPGKVTYVGRTMDEYTSLDDFDRQVMELDSKRQTVSKRLRDEEDEAGDSKDRYIVEYHEMTQTYKPVAATKAETKISIKKKANAKKSKKIMEEVSKNLDQEAEKASIIAEEETTPKATAVLIKDKAADKKAPTPQGEKLLASTQYTIEPFTVGSPSPGVSMETRTKAAVEKKNVHEDVHEQVSGRSRKLDIIQEEDQFFMPLYGKKSRKKNVISKMRVDISVLIEAGIYTLIEATSLLQTMLKVGEYVSMVIRTGKKFDYGEFVFNKVVSIAESDLIKAPMVYYVLIYSIIKSQLKNVATKMDYVIKPKKSLGIKISSDLPSASKKLLIISLHKHKTLDHAAERKKVQELLYELLQDEEFTRTTAENDQSLHTLAEIAVKESKDTQRKEGGFSTSAHSEKQTSVAAHEEEQGKQEEEKWKTKKGDNVDNEAARMKERVKKQKMRRKSKQKRKKMKRRKRKKKRTKRKKRKRKRKKKTLSLHNLMQTSLTEVESPLLILLC
ncbi:hypothetical protein C2S51_037145 [Perilla frutescens var. frutescens]|nr:hypothetical protein C2S51_037145 [Perilla frutescens var. frutescens]